MKGIVNVAFFAIFWLMAVVWTLGVGLIPLGVLLFFTYAGAVVRANKAEKIVQTTLMKDERLLAQATQHRVFALWSRRKSIAITTSRIIIITRGLVGGFKMADTQWKDLKDAKLEQNVLDSICGSNLLFHHYNSGVDGMGVDGVRSDVAAEIYSRAQSEEQAWEEKRRIRAMEEVRAAAGGVTVHTGSSQTPLAATQAGNRMMDEIQRAKKLLDDGVISDAEFQEMKSKILAAT
ncbi:hypothetical protein MMB232_01068 [Brevundimonas subvibrioides]|uniref:SHOCT domain-containing protein n=1 Tax=Brevundimonas subvibrioides TaxID=74313 RepID=UPI0032D5A9BC